MHIYTCVWIVHLPLFFLFSFFMRIYIFVYTWTSLWMSTCNYEGMCVCVCVCVGMYKWIDVGTFPWMYVFLCGCIFLDWNWLKICIFFEGTCSVEHSWREIKTKTRHPETHRLQYGVACYTQIHLAYKSV